jgi:hypothetical protein
MPHSLREILHDAAALPRQPLDLERLRARGRRRVRLAGAGAITVLVAGLLATLVVVVRPDPRRPAPDPTVATGTGLLAELPAGWTEMPSPPEIRHHGATQWTGDTLLMWGGTVPGFTKTPAADGFIFDARTRAWTDIAESPLAARVHPASAWTGQELLVWGGLDGDSLSTGQLGDGAAYDPRQRIWRALPPAPISPRAALSVWTGEELIVWGTAVRVEQPPRDGAAYRPATNSWRQIPDAPVELTDAAAVWTGTELIVFGAKLSPADNSPATNTAIGAAYNPSTGKWRRLPDSALSPQASTASWSGTEMIAWDYLGNAAAYDPVLDRWRLLPAVPVGPAECIPRSVALDGRIAVVGEFCGVMVTFDAGRDVWRPVPGPARVDWWLELVAATPVVLVLGRDTNTPDEGLLAYRPSA